MRLSATRDGLFVYTARSPTSNFPGEGLLHHQDRLEYASGAASY